MEKILKYLKYSGIWFGVVVNPYHWRFGFSKDTFGVNYGDYIFENCLHVGPVWIRVIIDDGRW